MITEHLGIKIPDWFKERKHRKILERYANFHWQNGGKEQMEKQIKEEIEKSFLYGTSITEYL